MQYSKIALVFDTNVLLDFYKFTKKTTENVIDFFENTGYDIIIAPTVADEYYRHYQKERALTGVRNPISTYKKSNIEELKK